MRRAFAACSVVLALLAASLAGAADYYFPEDKPGQPGVVATWVYTSSGPLTQGQIYKFETRDLSDGADTVMHLSRGDLFHEVPYGYNDDCAVPKPGQSPLRSCFTIQAPATDTYYLIVYAYSPDSGGRGGMTFKPYVNGAPLHNGTPQVLGGYVIDKTTAREESFETVLVNDGCKATGIARLDWDQAAGHHKPKALDFTSGVGSGSRLFANQAVPGNWSYKWIITTAQAGPQARPTRVLRNDALIRDDDDDGLGTYLEAELGTCGQASGTLPSGYNCAWVADSRDTDGDGLSDLWEEIGFDHFSYAHVQYFPMWGASGKRKDVFVEIDRHNDGDSGHLAACLFTQADAEWGAQRYAVLDVGNPDGSTGISAHFALEVPCTEPGDNDGITSICGDLGGAGVNTGDECTFSPTYTAFSEARRGKFHWTQVAFGGGGTAPVPGSTFCSYSDSKHQVVPHELGHNLGLNHFGAAIARGANTKPNYPSLMNYNYQYWIGGSSSTWFSTGALAEWPLDPRSLKEVDRYPLSVDVSFMTGVSGAPYFFATDPANTTSWSIDWNRDGDFTAAEVRAHVSPAAEHDNWGDVDPNDQPISQQWEYLPDLPNRTTPQDTGVAAAAFDLLDPEYYPVPHTFVFTKHPDTNKFWFTYMDDQFVTGAWQSWTLVGSTVFHQTGHPAAAVLNLPAGDRLFVFGVPDSEPYRVGYAIIDQYATPGAWTTLGDNPGGARFREVAVTPYTQNGTTRLLVVARDVLAAPGQLWYGFLDRNLAWSGWESVDYMLSPVISLDYTPAVAGGPDGRAYMVVKHDGPGTDRDRRLFLWGFDGSSWSPYLDQDEGYWHAHEGVLEARPSMVFRWRRKADGNDLTTGAFWVWSTTKDDKGELTMRYRFTWGKFDASHNDFGAPGLSMGPWHWPGHRGPETDQVPGAIGLAASAHGLRAFVAYVNGEPAGILHIPYADGEARPERLINDYKDATTIDETLCASLDCPYGGERAMTTPRASPTVAVCPGPSRP